MVPPRFSGTDLRNYPKRGTFVIDCSLFPILKGSKNALCSSVVWAVIPHASEDVPFLWAFLFGKHPRSFYSLLCFMRMRYMRSVWWTKHDTSYTYEPLHAGVLAPGSLQNSSLISANYTTFNIYESERVKNVASVPSNASYMREVSRLVHRTYESLFVSCKEYPGMYAYECKSISFMGRK